MRNSVIAHDHVARWKYTGAQRPPFAVVPSESQESVWDYPRPPRCDIEPRSITVKDDKNETIAFSDRSLAIKLYRFLFYKNRCETSSPPVYYIRPQDVKIALVKVPGSSGCEWKGNATYWAHPNSPRQVIGWTYDDPEPEYLSLKGCFAFYPSRNQCFLGEERVQAQKSEFYGGWVYEGLVGPFKEGSTQAWEINN